MASLAFVSFASYFDQQGVWQLTFLGADPSVFFFAISFSVAWFLMFVAIPYVGNYNCVTMGWCYTGLIAAAFQKLGPYKLRVRSRQICKDCTTLDCAKGCPVGLVDMVGHFRTKGEFRSSKCCGVGDCAEDCPYGNLYLYDIRHWVLEHLGRPAAPAESQRLPMMSH
jgi:polyferredoxin